MKDTVVKDDYWVLFGGGVKLILGQSWVWKNKSGAPVHTYPEQGLPGLLRALTVFADRGSLVKSYRR